ncbi:MAG: lactate dehydrogenase [Betaproteobacteria bacterium]|nr:lactate dehydrogenase [Betaproteobacteria bacterium]
MNAPVAESALRPVASGPLLSRSRLADLLRRHTQGEVLFDAATRGRYSTDASFYQVEPIGVFVPKSEDDVRMAFAIARDLKTPILARGAGTSQCGQTVGECLVIDNTRYLNQIISFDKDAATVVVQPGIVLDHLNAWLKPHGLWFPVDVSTSAQATIGGMAGNNSCGSRSIAYGNMVHNVLGIDALLADGTEIHFGSFDEPLTGNRERQIVTTLFALASRENDEIERAWPHVMRRVGGYNLDIFNCQSERPYTEDGTVNLSHILVGSEGSLAYSRRLTLKLSPLPRHKVLGVVNFESFHKAMDSAQHIVKLKPVAVELVDRTMIDLARANPAFRPVVDAALIGAPQAILLVEFAGEDKDTQLRHLKDLVALMGDLGMPGSVVEMTDANAQKELWEVRKAGLNIMMSMKGDGKPVSFIEDCAVPLEHLAEYTDSLTEVFAKHGTRGTWYAHASVGTLHVRPVLDMRRDGATKMRAIAEEAGALVRKFKGAFSGEHGDGIVRGEWVEWQYGHRINEVFKEIKYVFDPDNLLNPGKIVHTPKMDDKSLFRLKPGYAMASTATALDWSAWNVSADPATDEVSAPGTGGDPSLGLGKALEMCNNNGHCRKFDAGTMCPSYRVTREEKHLTRGRANTLRLALSGQLSGIAATEALASDEVHDALDLCVSCKGCKRDCPTGVDMAKMKIEALHQYNAKHGLSLKDKLIAYLPHYAPRASGFAWVMNLRDTLPGGAWLSEKVAGFSARRSLPRWGSAFTRSAAPKQTGTGEVVLLADTFNNYFESENLKDALKVLEAAGYRVHLSAKPGERPLCCGRTFLASGLTEQAKAEARRMLDALLPFVERGVPVVGLEPSCLLTLRDEFLVYGFGEAAQKLADHALLFEEFLARESDAGRLKLPLKALPETKALLHGHCHQKAFDAVKPVQKVLGLIPGMNVELIESSCCGMAGAFGYEKDHIDVSMQMAELSLLPAVRKAGADTLIVADGTSCRHQIKDGAAREALHVARVLARALA